MNKTEATQLMDSIAKRQLPGVKATLIDMGDVHIIRLDKPDTNPDRCCVWHVLSPRDWARIALGEQKEEKRL